MSSNRSFMRSPSEKKTKPKMFVTLKQQSQSQAVDLRNSQITMNHFFESQSNISFSTDNNNKFQQQNRPSTNYLPNRSPYNPLKDSQVSFSNHSPASNNSRKPSFHQFNQSISKKNLNIVPQGSMTDRVKLVPSPNQVGNTKTQNYQTGPVPTGSVTHRTGHINSTPENRMTNDPQNNLNNPQSQQYTYRAQRKVQSNQSRNNSICIDPTAIIQENDQLKKNLLKIENDLKAQKEKNVYQSKRLLQGSNEIKRLKQKVEQLQEKTKPNKGFLNKIIDRRGSEPQNKRLQTQLIQTKKKVTELQKINKQINVQKDLMRKQHQKALREKENQLLLSMQSMNINLQFKNKEIKFKTNDNKTLQDQIKILQQKCKQQEQLTKLTQQRCQEQTRKKFQAQIDSLGKRVNQLSQELSKREQDKQMFASQLLQKLDVYMNPKGK